MKMEITNRKYRIVLLTSIFYIGLSGFEISGAFAQNKMLSEIECYELIHNTIDSTFLAEIGKEKYLTITDSLKLFIKIKIDSGGEVVCCQLVKSNDFLDSQFATILCQAISKLNLLCLYRLNFGDHYLSDYKSYTIPYNKHFSKVWLLNINKIEKYPKDHEKK